MVKITYVVYEKHDTTQQLFTGLHKEGNNIFKPKDILPINNKKTNEKTISQYIEDNSTRSEEDTVNHLNELISCKVINLESESKSNEERDNANYNHTDNKFET